MMIKDIKREVTVVVFDNVLRQRVLAEQSRESPSFARIKTLVSNLHIWYEMDTKYRRFLSRSKFLP